MSDAVQSFYDDLAEHYHLIFEDWDRSIARQAGVLGRLIAAHDSRVPLRILDCACGIGTQALGLAGLGHEVVGSDLSPAAIQRARREAAKRSLAISFRVSDLTSLHEIEQQDFDVVMAMDNALPHLEIEDLRRAVRAIASKLKPGGLFLASIRDYDRLLEERPAMQEPAFYGEGETRRIVHQVWDWSPAESYVVHLYLTENREGEWRTRHFVSQYHGLRREVLSALLSDAGFSDVRWVMPAESGFYQPIVQATLRG